jgi:hypothetical protein
MTQAEARRRIEQAAAEGSTKLDLAGLGLREICYDSLGDRTIQYSVNYQL